MKKFIATALLIFSVAGCAQQQCWNTIPIGVPYVVLMGSMCTGEVKEIILEKTQKHGEDFLRKKQLNNEKKVF